MIKKIENITLLGTSHIAKESAKEIENQINIIKPDIVAIELDSQRLKNILEKNKEKTPFLKVVKEVGTFGAIFASIASNFQQKIAKELGVEPGIDMKTAYLKAKENEIKTALIDQNVKITLKKLSKIKTTKKIKLFFNIIRKSFKKEYRNQFNIDPKKGVPSEDIIIKAMEMLKKEAPPIYDVLIEQRNKFMVNKILRLYQKEEKPKILVVIGAGHLNGMLELLNEELNKNKFTFSFKQEI